MPGAGWQPRAHVAFSLKSDIGSRNVLRSTHLVTCAPPSTVHTRPRDRPSHIYVILQDTNESHTVCYYKLYRVLLLHSRSPETGIFAAVNQISSKIPLPFICSLHSALLVSFINGCDDGDDTGNNSNPHSSQFSLAHFVRFVADGVFGSKRPEKWRRL